MKGSQIFNPLNGTLICIVFPITVWGVKTHSFYNSSLGVVVRAPMNALTNSYCKRSNKLWFPLKIQRSAVNAEFQVVHRHGTNLTYSVPGTNNNHEVILQKSIVLTTIIDSSYNCAWILSGQMLWSITAYGCKKYY